MADKKSKKPVGVIPASGFANSIVHENYLQIRQSLIDRYWYGRLEIYDEIRDVTRKPPSKRTRADWDAFYLDLADLVNSETETGSYSHPDSLPDSPASQASFQQALGIKFNTLRSMDKGTHTYTVDDLIAIAYVGNVDVAHMLTPANEVLMLDAPFTPAYPLPSESSLVDWVLWISNLRPITGNDSQDYLVNTSLATIRFGGVNMKRKRFGDSGSEIKARSKLPMSTSKVLKVTDPDSGKVPAIRSEFEANSTPWVPKTRNNSLEAIQRTLYVRMRLRTLANLTTAKGSKSTLKTKFERRLDFFTRDLKNLLNLFRNQEF